MRELSRVRPMCLHRHLTSRHAPPSAVEQIAKKKHRSTHRCWFTGGTENLKLQVLYVLCGY